MTNPTNDPPFQLKNMYSPALVERHARLLQASWQPFPIAAFTGQVLDHNWQHLELKERMRHISFCLREHLPESYPEAVAILLKTTAGLIKKEGEKMVFEDGFYADFVERYGLEMPDVSIPALEHITQRTSAEFAVRPYILKYPERMFAQMLAWSQHPSYCVRRLSSEGFRPRLPWGMGVPVLKKDPSKILPVLENLKNDPSETVRRSVANNLNDISKDHPDLMLSIAKKWQGQSLETDWVVRHACRGLLKKGHPEALLLFGFDQAAVEVGVADFQCPESVAKGGRLDFSFSIENRQAVPAKLRVEYAIDYLTSSGKVSYKVFKIKELNLLPGQVEVFVKYQRFQDFTTRKHFAGTHRLALLVNGKEVAAKPFEVV